MRQSVTKVLVSLLCFSCLVATGQAQQATPTDPNLAPLDLRILIDISGSMRDTDPNNLRIPAVNLLVELLPEGSTAGVWTFGQFVNMLVPHGSVDSAWRQQARQRANDINSVALHTNIGEAIERASYDFGFSTGRNPKHYIILTDGKVDIPPSAAASRAERDRIIRDIVPRVREHNGTIHMVGLSDDLDDTLMSQLAAQTGGLSAVAEDAEELLALFLQVMNASLGDQAREEVGLDLDQQFRIDSSVSEFTAVIFRPEPTPVTLVAPGGQRYTPDQLPANSEWLVSERYDLITIRMPASGTWAVEGELGANSRVAVVSDLNLQVNPLPLNIMAQNEVPLLARFRDIDGAVTDQEFLDLMTLTAVVRQGATVLQRGTLTRSGNEFVGNVTMPSGEGSYDVVVEADGQTFNRRRVFSVNVREPLAVEVIPRTTSYEIRVYPNLPEMTEQEMRLVAQVDGPDGSAQFLPFTQQPAGYWAVDVAGNRGDGHYSVDVNVQFIGAEQPAGDVVIAPIVLVFPVQAGDPRSISAQQAQPPAARQPAEPVPAMPAPTIPEPPPVSEAPQETLTVPTPVEPIEIGEEGLPDDWLDFVPEGERRSADWLPYALAGGSGLLFLILLYLVYRRFEGRNKLDDLDLDEPLSKAERAVLEELDGKEVDEEVYVDKPAAAPEAEAAEEDEIPTISDAVQNAEEDGAVEDEEPSILDDEFDLESLGIKDGASADTGLDDLDDWEDIISDDDSAFDEKLAPDEFDLSDDDIDDMLDDSLLDDDELPEDDKNKGG
ncbi:VWA domain-containing protein [Salinispirillum sp. LH 10-3-1]|uniref:VWA domain-containing protein n=1 Tax=Salinispirillum sp. LH 10-3-1 TaxID=2952525 RepID=A0AB38YJT6_9GAMM